jgi:hypothetical protein
MPWNLSVNGKEAVGVLKQKNKMWAPCFRDPLEDDLDLEAGLVDEDEDQRLLDEDLEIELGEAGRNWERPPVPAFDPQQESLSTSSPFWIGDKQSH